MSAWMDARMSEQGIKQVSKDCLSECMNERVNG